MEPSKHGACRTIVRIERVGALKIDRGLGIFGRSVVANIDLHASEISVVCRRIGGAASGVGLAVLVDQPELECSGYASDDLVLQGEHVRPLAVEALGPDMATCLDIDQLGIEPHILACTARAAFQDVTDAEFLRDLRRLHGLALVAEGGVAGDDEEAGDACKVGRQVVGDTVGEVALFLVVAEIGEGQNDQRGFALRQRRFGFDDRLGSWRPCEPGLSGISVCGP